MNLARSAQNVPRATYRLQLGPEFGFRQARERLPYLDRLGISHLYLSPIFRARRGSPHGYDVVDHAHINEELGSRMDLEALSAAARKLGLGIIVDIVPNHMAVMTDANAWWMDVLENGRASRFAEFFDIDWNPGRESMRNRLLVPILGSTFGETIASGELQVALDTAAGAFELHYREHRLPLDPRHYPLIFADAREELAGWPADDPDRQDFDSLLDAFAALPDATDTNPESVERRNRDKEVNKRRLARLCERRPDLPVLFAHVLARVNGVQGRDDSFDSLSALLDSQPYRLAFWRVSGEEINYRRFFDVNDLAALRMEEPAVFEATHRLLVELVNTGVIQGLRVDHADGLHDPKRYFENLAAAVRDAPAPPYIVAEKILAANETLRPDWGVDGTTGYEFGASTTSWLMRADKFPALQRTYHRYVGSASSFDAIVYLSKKEVMRSSLAAEISVLAAQLDRVAQMHRNSADFTAFDLREAVVELIACFPVYRTYINGDGLSADDRQIIRRAVGVALSHRGATRPALMFLQEVLCAEIPGGERQRAAALEFTMKFQQVTGPVMAKGVEDTSFYRYGALLALNEVGGDPGRRAVATELLHEGNAQRAQHFPHCLLASSTHDTKRGEDARWRLAALSETAELWRTCLARWRRLKRRSSHSEHPISAEDEYLLLQSALAVWPLDVDPSIGQLTALRTRLEEYALKAAREAKLSTSWLDPDPAYEKALMDFVGVLLPKRGTGGFQRYFRPVIDFISLAGTLNMLSATVLKMTVPGVPDLYQGSELAHLVFVDPDNRRIPDWGALEHGLETLLGDIERSSWQHVAAQLLTDWRSDRLKQFVTWRLLQLRRMESALFAEGEYLPLSVLGEHAEHVAAFARLGASSGISRQGRAVIVLVTRYTSAFAAGGPALGELWRHTQVALPRQVPGGRWFDALTGANHEIPDVVAVGGNAMSAIHEVNAGAELPVTRLVTEPDARLLSLAECFATLPVAVLVLIPPAAESTT